MVVTTNIPSREELVRRASELIPLLQKNSAWNEENRRIHEESIEALADAGFFKLRRPKRYGGFEVDTRTLVDIAAEVGQGDGSTSWVLSVYWIPTFMACMFPDEVQDEVFATPDVRVCGTLSPSAFAAQVDGGIVVNGKWAFISGAHHAQWQEIIAILAPEGGQPYPVMALVPLSELLVIDDWQTSGLRGTGSVSTVAKDVFIPQERVLPLPAVLQGQYASKANASSLIYRAPLLPAASASSVGTMLGMGRAARDLFLKRLPDRKITYTGYESQREAPVTHLQVADASQKLDQAEFHAHRLASIVDSKAAEGAEWKLDERVRTRADMGTVVKLIKETVDTFFSASGGSAIYNGVPIQRLHRDIFAVAQHALLNPNTNAELYGRVLCGLEPNSLYI
jgi:alkylation response protein AidB-like acyl-CoA dehydrogenase